MDILTDTLLRPSAKILLDTLASVQAKALFNTLADPVAEAKVGTPCITLAHINPQVLIITRNNTLVQAKSDTIGDTGESYGADTC